MVKPTQKPQEFSSRRKASRSSRNSRNRHTNSHRISVVRSPVPDNGDKEAYDEHTPVIEDDVTPIARPPSSAEMEPKGASSVNGFQITSSVYNHNLLSKQMEDSICSLTPVEMDLGALAMIASLSNTTTPILANKINASTDGRLATPQPGLRLKSGSVIAMVTPEQSCWSRAPYIAGEIMMSHEFLLPTTMMTDMDQLAWFIGATSSFEARIKSDDAILDDIVDFFGDMGLLDVDPFVRPMHVDLPPPMILAESQESPEIEEAEEAEEPEASDLGSDRWSGSTGWSAARTTLSSIDEISRGGLGRDETLSDLPNTPGSRSSNASSLSNAWVQRQFPSFTDDLAKHRVSGQSTLPDTWTNRHSLPASERSSVPSPRHPGSVGSERRGGARKPAPLKKGGKISIRRILASAGSIV